MVPEREIARYVLDSFALIAYLEDEVSAQTVEEMLTQAEQQQSEMYLCSINLGEIYYITHRERGSETAEETLAVIDQLPVCQVDADKDLVLSAAQIKASYPVSYADAFVAALAKHLDARIVTGDPEFQELELLVGVCWLPTS